MLFTTLGSDIGSANNNNDCDNNNNINLVLNYNIIINSAISSAILLRDKDVMLALR